MYDGATIVTGKPIADAAVPTRRDRLVYDLGLHEAQGLTKRSEDVVDFVFDASRFLEPGETIEAVKAWIVPIRAIDQPADPGDANILSAGFATTAAVVWIANGANNARYAVYCRIITSQSRQRVLRFVLMTMGTPTTATISGAVA